MLDTIDLLLAAVALAFVFWGGYLSLAATERCKVDVRNIAHHRRRTDGLPSLRAVDFSSASIAHASDFDIGFRKVQKHPLKRAA